MSEGKLCDEIRIGWCGAVLSCELVRSNVPLFPRRYCLPLLLAGKCGRPRSPTHGEVDGDYLIGVGRSNPKGLRHDMACTVLDLLVFLWNRHLERFSDLVTLPDSSS